MKATGGLILLALSVMAAPRQATFRTTTQLVRIDVSVKQGNQPVANLASGDFVLTDNGIKQDIKATPGKAIPLDVTLLIGANAVRRVASRLAPDLKDIAAWLRPDDRLEVVGYAREVKVIRRLMPISEDQMPALTELWRAEPGIDPRHDPQLNGRVQYDALLLALMRPPELPRRRLAVLFWYDDQRGSIVPDGSILEEVAKRSETTLFVGSVAIPVNAVGTFDSTPHQYNRRVLTATAEATGGGLREVGGGVGAFKTIFETFRQSYVLQYTVTGTPTGGWHQIDVTTPGFPSYRIQSKKGYFGR